MYIYKCVCVCVCVFMDTYIVYKDIGVDMQRCICMYMCIWIHKKYFCIFEVINKQTN